MVLSLEFDDAPVLTEIFYDFMVLTALLEAALVSSVEFYDSPVLEEI